MTIVWSTSPRGERMGMAVAYTWRLLPPISRASSWWATARDRKAAAAGQPSQGPASRQST
jgi:hypothetical protein